MAILSHGIAGSVEPAGSYSKPPKGMYACRVVSTEDITKGNDMSFQMQLQIVGPPGNPAIGEKIPKTRTTWRYPKAKDNKSAAEDGVNAFFLKLIQIRQNLDGKEGVAKARAIAPQFDPVQHMMNQEVWVDWRPDSRPYADKDTGEQKLSDDIVLLTKKEFTEALAAGSTGASAAGTSAGAGGDNPFGPTAGAAGTQAANAFMNGSPTPTPAPAPTPTPAPAAEANPFN